MIGADDPQNQLITLIEAERAGVAAARRLLGEADSEDEVELLEEILEGERMSCRILGRSILDLGVKGSHKAGDFADKVMARPDKRERLELLIKGQDWVVRRIDEVLGSQCPSQVRGSLQEIRNVHIINIKKCHKHLEKLEDNGKV
jgi:nitronate monooxygenase